MPFSGSAVGDTADMGGLHFTRGRSRYLYGVLSFPAGLLSLGSTRGLTRWLHFASPLRVRRSFIFSARLSRIAASADGQSASAGVGVVGRAACHAALVLGCAYAFFCRLSFPLRFSVSPCAGVFSPPLLYDLEIFLSVPSVSSIYVIRAAPTGIRFILRLPLRHTSVPFARSLQRIFFRLFLCDHASKVRSTGRRGMRV